MTEKRGIKGRKSLQPFPSEAIDRTLAWTPRYRWKIASRSETQISHTRVGRQSLIPVFFLEYCAFYHPSVQTSHKITRESRHTQWEFSHLLPNWRLPWPLKRATVHATCTDFVSKSRTPLCFLQQFFENCNSLISVARQVWFMSGGAFMPHKSVCIALFLFAKYKHVKLIKILS